MRWKAAALLALAVAGTAAESRAQNGLERFERDVKPHLELKQLTYGSATALGKTGFQLGNVVAVVPGVGPNGDKDATIRIDKVIVEEIDLDRLGKDAKADELPRFANLRLEGVTGDETIGELLQPFGIARTPADLAVDYRLDPATKALTLNRLEIVLRGQARFTLAGSMEGIGDKADDVLGARDDGRLRSAVLEFDDSGLLAKVLPIVAKDSGLVAETMIKAATAQIGTFAQGQGPATTRALDALISFMTDWRQPKGPIKVSAKPANTVSLADLDKLAAPNALTDLLNLSIDYPGTRPGAAGRAAAAPPAPAPPPAGGGALAGAAAWLSVVGNTLTGEIDGEVIHEHYRKDGTLSLLQGSDVTNGRWSIEGERACFKYPDEDKECYSVQRTGNQVVLTSTRGRTFQLTVLAGNPKNL